MMMKMININDDDEIDDQIDDSFLPWLNQFPSFDPLSLVNISGDEDPTGDSRNLSDYTPDASLPISNLAESRHASSDRKSKTKNQKPKKKKIGTLDLTQGYHQTPTAEFLVKWQDYPNSANSWEPYSSLRDVAVLHDYLKLKKLNRLLNKQHR
jgi:Chromo (CHRromatin Organisation MOdifier) domain